MRSLSRAEVRDVDRRAIEDFGLLGIVLMENAGRNAAALLHEMVPGASIAIACGKGNNAGDGFVMARHLENLGHDVRILLAGDPADHRGDAATNWRVIERAGIAYRLTLPHVAFNRRIGEFAAIHADPEGRVIEAGAFAANRDRWLPSADDRMYITGLMRPVDTAGAYAGWIAPPKVGIDNKPGNFEYVKLWEA